MNLYEGRIEGMQYEQDLRREQEAKDAMRNQARQQARAQGLAAQAPIIQAQQARQTALEPIYQARMAEMLGQGLSATPQQAPVAPPKKVMELADFISNVAKGNTRQAEIDSGFVRPGSTRKNADGSFSFVSNEGEEVTISKDLADQGLGLRQKVPRSPLEEEYLRERIESTRAGTEAKQKPKELSIKDKEAIASARIGWQQAQRAVDDIKKEWGESDADFAIRKSQSKEQADADLLKQAYYDISGVTEENPVSAPPIVATTKKAGPSVSERLLWGAKGLATVNPVGAAIRKGIGLMNASPVNPNSPEMSAQASGLARGSAKEFASPAEAEKAGLPKGTEVVIGGRRAIIE